MAKTISVLCIHGVGHGDADADLAARWTRAIEEGLAAWAPARGQAVACDFLKYDALFDRAPLDAATYGEALARLLASGVTHGIGDLFPGARGFADIPDRLRWSAGMVAQWASDERLREAACAAVLEKLQAGSYDVVCAHSLGSLISYDTFRRNPKAIAGKVFVTLGSQIGNPCVRDAFAGRVEPLDQARMWFHLYTPNDRVMTAEVRLAADNFRQVRAEFDIPDDVLNHEATWYLGHPNARSAVWREVAGAPVGRALAAESRAFGTLSRKPDRRALLVGIDAYPDPANRLAGCVNDVFLMSSVLQECGFDAAEIRVVLNERATAAGILERLHWLLDGVKDGDWRVLYYSGHGAQMPAYGATDEVDHMDECLVPYDFDWSPERAVTDKQFRELYSQLPYDSHFAAIFDCCHAGGMTREGSRKVRGLDPPDDIRHRAMRWNAGLQMWEDRPIGPANPSLAEGRDGRNYVGSSGVVHRIGRAVGLRTLPNTRYDALRRALKHRGPYLPVILEACQESQLSYEYRHGVQSYGAFTYSLAAELRAARAAGGNPSFVELVDGIGERLRHLKYEQTPCLTGAKAVVRQPVPWTGPAKASGPRKKPRR